MIVSQKCPSESGRTPWKVLAAMRPRLPRLALPKDVPLDIQGAPQTWRGHCYSVSLENFESIQSKQTFFFSFRTSRVLQYDNTPCKSLRKGSSVQNFPSSLDHPSL